MNEKRKRIIVHVDMDAFYSSIEQMDRAEYRNRPVVVGADPRGGRGRGVVSAASYEARKYGIHSAMPISQAYRLCPEAVYVRPRMRRYESVSKHIMRILEQFSPLVEQISIDEAFLDCTGTEGNLNLDPSFVDPDAGDYRLSLTSPAVDAGSAPDSGQTPWLRVVFSTTLLSDRLRPHILEAFA